MNHQTIKMGMYMSTPTQLEQALRYLFNYRKVAQFPLVFSLQLALMNSLNSWGVSYNLVTEKEKTLVLFADGSSSILTWRIPWTEVTDRLQSIGLQTVGHDWSNLAPTHFKVSVYSLTRKFAWVLQLPRDQGESGENPPCTLTDLF